MFGLIHGFGFAADLLEMKLPPKRLAELLFGFNLGVEIGQLTLVVGVSLAAYALLAHQADAAAADRRRRDRRAARRRRPLLVYRRSFA